MCRSGATSPASGCWVTAGATGRPRRSLPVGTEASEHRRCAEWSHRIGLQLYAIDQSNSAAWSVRGRCKVAGYSCIDCGRCWSSWRSCSRAPSTRSRQAITGRPSPSSAPTGAERAGILADSCVLPEPRYQVTPTHQHIPDRDTPGEPAALTPRKQVQRHSQSAIARFSALLARPAVRTP